MIDRAIGVVGLIIGLASLAVVLSKRSDTSRVVGTIGDALNKLFATAISPVTK